MAIVAVGGLFLLRPGNKSLPPEPQNEGDPVTTTEQPAPPPDKVSVAPALAPTRATPSGTATAGPGASAGAQALPLGSPETRQLVTSLVNLQVTNGQLTPEQAGAWRTNLAQLAVHGAEAIPAIREFLDKNTDFDFGAGGKQLLGYPSARLALIDVLGRAGGADAINALSGVLGVTADPREIAALAKSLEQLEPGMHRQAALDAARQALGMAAEGKLTERDVAPLFEVFQNYGDSSIAPDLAQQSKTWNYYSMFALAKLPEGGGIPTLVQIVNGEAGAGSGAKVAALEMLAQTAGQSEIARNALLEQVKGNKLTAYNWATLECILGGDQVRFQDSSFDPGMSAVKPGDLRRTHINSGNQNFFSAPPANGFTAEQIQQQKELIRVLREATTDANGLQVLQRAEALLDRRANLMPLPTAASNP